MGDVREEELNRLADQIGIYSDNDVDASRLGRLAHHWESQLRALSARAAVPEIMRSDLPINDSVPAPTRILPGNLFLWNWEAMQEYGLACIAHVTLLSAAPQPSASAPEGWQHAMRDLLTQFEHNGYSSDPEHPDFIAASNARALLASAPQPAGEAEKVGAFGERFIDGMGWAVPCSRAAAYVGAMRKATLAMAEKEVGQYVGAGAHGIADEPAPSAPADAMALAQLIADDGFACTFQTMGLYRSALLREARRFSVPATVKDCLTTAEMEMREDGERFAFLVSRWSNNTGTLRQSTPADDAILNSLTTGDMPAIRLVIDNVRRLSGAQQAAKDGA